MLCACQVQLLLAATSPLWSLLSEAPPPAVPHHQPCSQCSSIRQLLICIQEIGHNYKAGHQAQRLAAKQQLALTSSGEGARRTPVPSDVYISSALPALGKHSRRSLHGREARGSFCRLGEIICTCLRQR